MPVGGSGVISGGNCPVFERLKGLVPFRANLDSPAAIILVRFSRRVVASVFHVVPNVIEAFVFPVF